jgi:hypothetical protein
MSSKNLLFIRAHSRKSVVMLFSEFLKETAYRGLARMHADRLARRDGLLYATMPSMSLLVIRECSCDSAVRLFGECLNETAIRRIDTNTR